MNKKVAQELKPPDDLSHITRLGVWGRDYKTIAMSIAMHIRIKSQCEVANTLEH